MKLNHIYREQNNTADGLAMLGHSHTSGCHFYEDIPPSVFGLPRFLG